MYRTISNMAFLMGPSSKKRRLQKCFHQSEQVEGDDPFSQLPDEIILFHILSRFTLEEAAQYSILSRRWKKLWARSIGTKLIFAPEHLQYTHQRPTTDDRSLGFGIGCARKIMDRISQLKSCSHSKNNLEDKIIRLRVCFECWISNVLQAFCQPKLDELTVRFPFDSSSTDSIDGWVECALIKGVTRLELDLYRWGKMSNGKTYSFPKLEKLKGMLANCAGLHNLRDVSLKSVAVCPLVVEFMLAHFPLERLCIWASYLGKLRISGESVRLKTLELLNCVFDLTISSPSLISLMCTCLDARLASSLDLEHVPNLSELSVDEKFSRTFVRTGFINIAYFTGLKRLEFAMSEEAVRESINYPLELPETLNLEELKVEIHGRMDSCLLWPVLLIKAAPFLRGFSVKFLLMLSERETPGQLNDDHLIDIRSAAKRACHHRYLKSVVLRNYSGFPPELEVLRHLSRVSDSLEQFVVAPINFNGVQMLRNQTKEQIAMWLPPSSKADVIVL